MYVQTLRLEPAASHDGRCLFHSKMAGAIAEPTAANREPSACIQFACTGTCDGHIYEAYVITEYTHMICACSKNTFTQLRRLKLLVLRSSSFPAIA